jgi:tRNA uridine 5-carbamoylmethylation protein Kti12
MSEILKGILKINKLIKVLVKEEDIDDLKIFLNKKDELIKLYNNEGSKNEEDKKILKNINDLDIENVESFKQLMNKTKTLMDEVKNQKGNVINNNNKLKKYHLNNIKSGYRIDRKK